MRFLPVFFVFLFMGLGAAQADTEKRVSDPVFQGEMLVRLAGPETAPTVVLVHGLGDKASTDWDGLSSDLARQYRVLRYDLPGFGQSSKGNQAYTPDNYVRSLRALIDRNVRARPFYLVGHSMGGAIALRYAAQYPQDVKALVLAGVPAILHRSVYSKHMVAYGLRGLVPGFDIGNNDFIETKLGTLTNKLEKRQLPIEMAVQLPLLRQKLLQGDPTRIAGMALALEDFSQDLGRVQAPTLLLWGAQDLIAPVRNGWVLAANIVRARLEVLPESGHTPMDDVPFKFQEQVRRFLASPVIPERYVAVRDPAPLPASERRGHCDGKRGQVFEGDFERIDLVGCDGAILRNVRVRNLRIVGSRVSINDSRIGDLNGGLFTERSRLIITSSRIEGNPAIRAADTMLDVAGSRLIGQQSAITTPNLAELVCSVCEVQGVSLHGTLHGVRTITPESPL